MAFPIYALWAHPRSMSTATERIMRERGDLDCLHEPFMYDYYINRAVRRMPLFEPEPEKPQNFMEIQEHLLSRSQIQPVFLKDMSYYLSPYLETEIEFLGAIKSAFLIRDPIAAILSYFKLDKDLNLEEVGIEAQWRHYVWLKENGYDPLVLKSEDIRANPSQVMKRLWSAWDLKNRPEALMWDQTAPSDWGQVDGWHSTSIAQGQIKPMVANENESRAKEFAKLSKANPKLSNFSPTMRPTMISLRKLRFEFLRQTGRSGTNWLSQ